MSIYLTSDLHFCHKKDFLYKPRGFSSIGEMNYAIVSIWNNTVQDDDDIYILGDIMLNDDEEGIFLLKNLRGRIHIIRGNHDSDRRIELYKQCPHIVVEHNKPIFNGWDADVIIHDIKVAVLWNGRWHYEQIKKSQSVAQVQNRDKIKIGEIERAGYTPYVIKDMGKASEKKVNTEFETFLNWTKTLDAE